MDEITLRMIERLIAVLIGGLSIYLGFSLFKAIPHNVSGEGKFTFPGGSIHLFRTGPGVFFALFGCAIVFWSFSHPIEVTMPESGGITSEISSQVPMFFKGLSSENMEEVSIWIQNLNRMDKTTCFDDQIIDKGEVSLTISQIKLFLIRNMLDDPSDPEFAEFSYKIRINSSQNFDNKWQKWADIYNLQ